MDVDVRAGSSMILKYAEMTKPTAAMMTPSLTEYLIEKSTELIGKSVGDLGLSALFTVGELGIGIPEIKVKIENAYGCRVYDYYGIHCVAE